MSARMVEKGKPESQPHSDPTTSDVLYITALVARPRQSTMFEAAVSGRLDMVALQGCQPPTNGAGQDPWDLSQTRGHVDNEDVRSSSGAVHRYIVSFTTSSAG